MGSYFSGITDWSEVAAQLRDPCMAINVSVQYDGGFLPDIILLTQCYYHRGTRLNAMKRFCIFSF